MSSRSYILDRLRVALGAQEPGRPQRCQGEWIELPRHYRRIGTLSLEQRVELFDDRLRHYHGTPFYCAGDVRGDVAEILRLRGKRIMIVPPDFPPEWRPADIFFIPDERLSNDQLNLNDGVVTLCKLGIASTGTVVLESNREQGRRAATLIPDYHLCVLRREDIVELVPEAIRKLQPLTGRPLTFFSGPSATVDIEMTRVGGVHGPRTLDVLIL